MKTKDKKESESHKRWEKSTANTHITGVPKEALEQIFNVIKDKQFLSCNERRRIYTLNGSTTCEEDWHEMVNLDIYANEANGFKDKDFLRQLVKCH